MNPYEAQSFEDFWPFYVRMHSRPETQRLHAVATLAAASLVVMGIALRQPLLVLIAPLADHLIAQLAHRRFERNRTRPWRNMPWHARAELRMLSLVLSGRMARETLRCAETKA
jgi:hypothetical protein